MTQQEKFEIALSLVDGFHSEIPEQGILKLYHQYIQNLALASSHYKESFPSLKTFKTKFLRCYIVNSLLESEYNNYFLDLEANQIAEILGISMKEYNSLFNQTVKKLKVLKLKQTRSLVEDSLQTLEQLEYTSSEDLKHPDD